MILVTGGTGMLGAHLLFQLACSEERVRATYRSSISLDRTRKVFSYYTDNVQDLFSKIDWVKTDITNISSLESAFEGVSSVYHLAAFVSFDSIAYKEMRDVNIIGTENIVNLCIAYRVQKLCYVSSIATITKSIQKTFIDEEDEFTVEQSNHGYAITKFGAEMEVWRGAQEGLSVFIVNPGVVLGPGFWKENSGALFTMVYEGSLFYTESVTGFVGVKDAVNILVKGMNSTIVNERFVLVSENKSFKEVLNLIAKSFHKPPPRIKASFLVVELGWRLSWLKSKLTSTPNRFTKQIARSANNKSYYSSEKVKRSFDFEFEPLETVIKKITENYLLDK